MMEMHHRRFFEQDFGLINPMRIAAAEYADLSLIPLIPPGLERHERLMPRLICLRELDEDDRIDLLERSERWQAQYAAPLFCALFQSSASAARLKRHWCTVMLACAPHFKAWLRLHDPLVFRHLPWLSGPEQIAFYMGPIARWTWFDPFNRHWQALESPTLEEGISPQPFTPAQLDSLELLEVVNACLRKLTRETPEYRLDNGTARALLAHARAACDAGLSDLDDRCFYVRLGLCHGSDFRNWPETIECLRRAAAGEISFIGAAICHDRLSLPDDTTEEQS